MFWVGVRETGGSGNAGGKSENPRSYRRGTWAFFCRLAVGAIPFVDHPKSAVTEADELVSSLMQARGYPVADFDQRAADISVDHPRLVENYRSAHGVAVRLGRDDTSTEDLRTAMIQYRNLFDELVEEQTPVGIKSVA